MDVDVVADILRAPIICLGWLIVGTIAGAIAHSVQRTNQPILVDIIVGLIGAMIGGLLVSLLGIYRPTGGAEGVLASLVIATLGAILFIAILRLLRGQRPLA